MEILPPLYFDAWTVDHALKEGVSSVYSAKSLREPDRTTQLNNISEKARREIIEQAGISDPELQVNLDMEDDVATMTAADYTVTIEHPGDRQIHPPPFSPRSQRQHQGRQLGLSAPRVGAMRLLLVAAGAIVAGTAGRALADGPAVVVVKRAGVTAYGEVSEEFEERCRVRAAVLSFGDGGLTSDMKESIRGSGLVVTIGQEALDLLSPPGTTRSGAHVIPTLAFHFPSGMVGPPMTPSPELVLRVLVTARHGLHRVATVYGPRSQGFLEVAKPAAERVGLELAAASATDGPDALRKLRALVDKGDISAIWLPDDSDVVTPQLFQYALGRVQLRRGIPIAATTRQQVHSGALLAVDFAARASGRAAARAGQSHPRRQERRRWRRRPLRRGAHQRQRHRRPAAGGR